MDKLTLENLLKQSKTKKEIASICNVTYTKVKYWLNKYGLLSKKEYLCKKCGETERVNFLEGRWYTCRKCRSYVMTEMHRRTKKKAIVYKGGKCQMCGYNKCPAALDFHHLDPSTKDPKWKTMRSWTFDTGEQEG